MTSNDLAWNEFIKRGTRYCEFGEFKSIKRQSQQEWPTAATPLAISSSISTATSRTTIDRQQQQQQQQPSQHPPQQPVAVLRPMTVRGQAEERRKRENDIARQALNMAETSVEAAMTFIKNIMPNKFMHHSKWYDREDENDKRKITIRIFIHLFLYLPFYFVLFIY